MNFPGRDGASDRDPAARAEAWIIRRDRGLTPEEKTEFEQLCFEDPEFYAAYLEAEALWDQIDRIPDQQRDHMRQWVDTTNPGKWRPLPLAAAALLAILILFSALFTWDRFSTEPESSGFQAASPTTQLLPDGTIIRLNQGTQLSIRFSDSIRKVYLDSGEAHFKVAHDPKRPLQVVVGGVAVEALGTAFNIHYQVSEIRVVVTEGRVQISEDPSGPDSNREQSTTPKLSLNNATLGSGQQALIRQQKKNSRTRLDMQITGVDQREVEKILSWQKPLLTLGGDSLGNIAENFEAKTGLRLVISDPGLRELRIGGRFPSENPQAFLNLLRANYGIQWYERGDGTLVVGENP